MIALLSCLVASAVLPTEAGTVEVVAHTEIRHPGVVGADWTLSDSVAVAAWGGIRRDRPLWTPAAGANLRLGNGRFGGLASGEWLGGLGGDGRIASADFRGVGIVEGRLGERVWTHAGAGAMALVMRNIPTVLCAVARTGADVAVTERVSTGVYAEVPVYQFSGPDMPGFNPTVAAQLRLEI